MPLLGVPEGVPSGTIAIWLDLISTIPQGWKLCDGTNGTPDLRSRFPKCVPNGVTNPGSTGGESEHTLTESEMPSHTHTFSVPNHQHDGDDDCEATTGSPTTLPRTGSTFTGEFLADISSTANISGVGNAGSGLPHNNIPRSKEVLYIQKS